ncbi:MAG: efflux RND transporter periplasmic adaptor subunit [Desulfobacterales bacterium]|nr:efflux RND transporter periplasmic adaptor subunit [Desulfobacterales bacterium]
MANDDLSLLKIKKSDKLGRLKRRKKTVYWVTVIIFIFMAAVLYSTGIIRPAVSVEVVSVSRIYPYQSFTLLNASGYVVAQRKAAVASKITGRLIALMVTEGSPVRKGQVIARLENEDAVAAQKQRQANLELSLAKVEQAKAELRETTLNYNRYRQLIQEGAVSQVDFDRVESRYKITKAALEAAEAAVKVSRAALLSADVMVQYAYIHAPFDAVVLTKNADIGDIVTPLGAAANAKAAVVTIADMTSLQVEADVSESNVERVKIGQPCEIQLDALPETPFPGVVDTIVPTADRTKATIMVKVRFLQMDPRILPEMSAKVSFLSREIRSDERALRTVVDRSGIVLQGSEYFVFLIRKNRALKTPVRIGAEFGNMVEIIDGLRVEEKIVSNPTKDLKPDSRIKVIEY